MAWLTYIVECSDGSLYTGITTDMAKRIVEHNKGTASKYTRSKLPVSVMWYEPQPDESSARKREAEIKKLPKNKKLELIKR